MIDTTLKLSQIFDEWEKDCKLDLTELHNESANRPSLHHKYSKMISIERVILKQLRSEYDVLYSTRADWFTGKISQEKLKEHGWEPNPLRIMKDDLSRYLKADKLLVDMSLRIGLQEEKISALDSILSSINSRQWDIRNAIEFMKFTNGVN